MFTGRIGDKVKSIALMCGYFGGRPSDNKGNVYTRPDGSEINGIWPLELPAFLISCEKNPTIDWKIVTNLEPPESYPKNVSFINIELEEMFERFKSKVGRDLLFTNLKKMGDVKSTWANTNLLKKLTGYRPETNYKIGVKNFIEWYREYYKK